MRGRFHKLINPLILFAYDIVTVAEVEHAFRRYRALKITESGANAFRPEGSNLVGLPPLPSNNSRKVSDSGGGHAGAGRGTALLDNKTGIPLFVEQLKMDWLLARVRHLLPTYSL
jgi:hypothetical protein